MPIHDIIIHFNAGIALLITYEIDQVLSKFDTLSCLNQAQNDIPHGAVLPVPNPLFYRSGDVVLSVTPNDSPVLLWSEWNNTLRALKWFAEQYEALALVFSVLDYLDSSKIMGSGAIAVS